MARHRRGRGIGSRRRAWRSRPHPEVDHVRQRFTRSTHFLVKKPFGTGPALQRPRPTDPYRRRPYSKRPSCRSRPTSRRGRCGGRSNTMRLLRHATRFMQRSPATTSRQGRSSSSCAAAAIGSLSFISTMMMASSTTFKPIRGRATTLASAGHSRASGPDDSGNTEVDDQRSAQGQSSRRPGAPEGDGHIATRRSAV